MLFRNGRKVAQFTAQNAGNLLSMTNSDNGASSDTNIKYFVDDKSATSEEFSAAISKLGEKPDAT